MVHCAAVGCGHQFCMPSHMWQCSRYLLNQHSERHALHHGSEVKLSTVSASLTILRYFGLIIFAKIC